ncbi:MAG: hypothetical protein NT154_06845, partial [Verrucomicrobia bacterium]|nr:hypothetical protein [Verrucomicrobiota bacterium]
MANVFVAVWEERAHMLLPLAWLVRVEDTPLHRQWLDWMVKYLQQGQHPCGAIPQNVDKPQTSNDQYGTGEAPIVYQTGDPATDMLYTMGFAISGMHEAAAATGNPEYALVEDRMAGFLVRIQTRCATRAELDGCWYRIFDYGKWDYWGSDGDVGWGVWSAETGWTQPWVAGTLALRQMKTSLWDLTKSSKAGRHFEKYRKLMLPAAIIEDGPGKADVPAAAFPLDKQRSQALPDKVTSDRAQISLAGTWSFQADRRNEGESAGWFTDGFDAKSWQTVEVPVAFDNCGTNMDRYTGVGWFRKQVYVPEPFGGRRIVLQFEGINYNAKVWVNGKPVGENHDAFLPFTLRINDAVQIGAENLITVRVDNLRTRGQFPLFEGWFGQGGFLREAYLVATDETLLTGTFIEAEPATSGGHISIRAMVTNGVNQVRPLQIQVWLLNVEGKELKALQSSTASLGPGQAGELTAEGFVPEVQLWSPSTPVLYNVHVVLMSDGRPLDSQTRRIGFRRIEVKDAKLLLNGQQQFLMGFDRHEDSPRTGMAVDLKQAREDFTAIKQLGGNFVRFCHYPHHPGELDLCDELGLLVLAENAMNEWGHLDHGDPNGGFALKPEDAPLILDNDKRTLRKMVLRDNHHPSILMWSVSNENAEERADVAAGNGELIQYGQTLDKSRPWTHVSNCFNKEGWDSFYRFDDAIVLNIYAGHKVSLARTNLEAKLPEATKYMEEVLAKLHRQFP